MQAETDLRMGHQGVYVYGGGRGRGQRGEGRASFLPRLSLLEMQNGGAGGLDMLIPGTLQSNARERGNGRFGDHPSWPISL